MSCSYCGGAKRFQIVSPVSDHAWANCFCTKPDYPTEDAYLRACRALHWRTAELRAHGIEPIVMPEDAAHYPPDDFDFGAPKQHVQKLERRI